MVDMIEKANRAARRIASPDLNLYQWIKTQTQGHDCTVELGCGFGDKLVHAATPKRIGIEIYKPDLDRCHECITRVNDDFRNFVVHLAPEDYDVAMMIDTIEHIDKESGLKLLRRLIQRFNKVLVFCPEGHMPQDAFPDNPAQEHVSSWEASEFTAIGFQDVQVIEGFHPDRGPDGGPVGAIFAVWERQ